MSDEPQPARLPWSDEMDEVFASVLGPGLAEVRRQVQAGSAFLIAWPDRGLTILRIERPDGAVPELVVVGAAGHDYRGGLEGMKRLARANGCRRIRGHSDDPRVLRLLRMLGFEYQETVVSLEV